MSLKKKALAKAVAGDPNYVPPTAEMLAQMATEVMTRNQDTLVANYILKNPDVPADQITLVTWTDSEGMHFKVQRTEIVPATEEVDNG